MHFYSGWLHPCLVCDSPFTPSHTATTEEERSRQGDNAEGSCVPFSCPLIEESCNYCRLPKLPPVQKRFIFDVKMGSGWLTVIPVSLPPRTPGAKAQKASAEKHLCGRRGGLEYCSFADYNSLTAGCRERVRKWACLCIKEEKLVLRIPKNQQRHQLGLKWNRLY